MTAIDEKESSTVMEENEAVSAPSVAVKRHVRTLKEFNALLERKYPRIMKEGNISETVVLLPSGQMINLWMTLQHYLYDGCIKGLSEGEELTEDRRSFFVGVSDYYCQFLSGIKIAEAAMPLQSMDKLSSMMSKFVQECLSELAASLIDKKHDEEIVHWFLKLAFTWSELHAMLLYYHKDKYKADIPAIPNDPVPMNLTFFHPYLTSKEWETFGTQVEAFGDSCCKDLIVSLVAQKLKYLTLFEEKNGANNTILQCSIRNSSKFIWTKLLESNPESWSDERYSLVSRNMEEVEIIELVHEFVTRIPMLKNDCKNYSSFTEDSRFHFALILEILDELLSKVIKMKIFRKLLKKIRTEVMCDERRVKLIKECTAVETSETSREILTDLLNVTNELIQDFEKSITVEETSSSCFSEDLLLPYLNFLSQLSLEEYPKTAKTIIFFTVMPCLVAVSQQGSKELLDLLVSILVSSSVDCVGNEFIFSVNWLKLFQWFSKTVTRFSITAKRQFAKIIFQNVYLSPKLIEDLNEEIHLLTKNFKLISPEAPIALALLEFLTQILGTQSRSKSKSKLSTYVQRHIHHLMHSLMKAIKKVKKLEDPTKFPTLLASIFRCSWLLQEAAQRICEAKADEDAEAVDAGKLKSIIEIQIEAALNYLRSFNAKEIVIDSADDEDDYSLNKELSRRYALVFLKCICKTKNFPEGFIMRLWKVYMKNGNVASTLTTFNEIPILHPRDIYLAASTEDFAEITQIIIREMEKQSSKESYNEMRIALLSQLLQEILDVELSPEKKTLRRTTIEAILYTSLSITLKWNNSSSCLNNVIIPFIQFEVNLLRRRNAICGTNALSLCLTSITSVPLNDITNIKLYRRVFCVVGDLLNSFTVHRLDVLSFRIHLYLQCFQYVVESITMKGDQKNKLTDDEILDLRYCAHIIERICQSAKLGQKEFSRVSPYFVAILMRQFEIFTIYPAVKDPLLSGCYKLLDLCDNYGIAQLNSMFTLGSREIFKTVYDVYKKFYRYTGKV